MGLSKGKEIENALNSIITNVRNWVSSYRRTRNPFGRAFIIKLRFASAISTVFVVMQIKDSLRVLAIRGDGEVDEREWLAHIRIVEQGLVGKKVLAVLVRVEGESYRFMGKRWKLKVWNLSFNSQVSFWQFVTNKVQLTINVVNFFLS